MTFTPGFSESELSAILQDIPLNSCRQMYCQHDEVAGHFVSALKRARLFIQDEVGPF